jgi:hypothetical protein
MIVDQKLNKQFVGVYLIDGGIDGTQLATTTKPNWFRRMSTRLFLGWKWISIKKLKATPKSWKEELKEWFLESWESLKVWFFEVLESLKKRIINLLTTLKIRK